MRIPVSSAYALSVIASLSLLSACSGSGTSGSALSPSSLASRTMPQSLAQQKAKSCVANTNATNVQFPGVPLASDATFAVLGGSTVTNAGPTVVNGNLGVYPGTSITGFGPGVVNGTIHAGDAIAAQAHSDLTVAYNNAMGRKNALDVSPEIGGTVMTPGLYKPTSSLGISGNVTLDGKGNPNAVFIFQIPSTLTTTANSSVTLINGTRACNVFWAVGSSATLQTASMFSGVLFAFASVSLGTGTQVQGRLLARSGAITLLSNLITEPAP